MRQADTAKTTIAVGDESARNPHGTPPVRTSRGAAQQGDGRGRLLRRSAARSMCAIHVRDPWGPLRSPTAIIVRRLASKCPVICERWYKGDSRKLAKQNVGETLECGGRARNECRHRLRRAGRRRRCMYPARDSLQRRLGAYLSARTPRCRSGFWESPKVEDYFPAPRTPRDVWKWRPMLAAVLLRSLDDEPR